MRTTLHAKPRGSVAPAPTRRSTRVPKPSARQQARSEARNEPTALTDAEQRHELIAVAAYLRAEKRGFAAGHELEDWLAAEQEVDRQRTAVDETAQPETVEPGSE